MLYLQVQQVNTFKQNCLRMGTAAVHFLLTIRLVIFCINNPDFKDTGFGSKEKFSLWCQEMSTTPKLTLCYSVVLPSPILKQHQI
jgi:hypothetical protein